eukprot:1158656-Pelagomonas_calceolata.AAC.4
MKGPTSGSAQVAAYEHALQQAAHGATDAAVAELRQLLEEPLLTPEACERSQLLYFLGALSLYEEAHTQVPWGVLLQAWERG